MRNSGNNSQWSNGYPSQDIIWGDVSRGVGFVIEEDACVVAYYAFVPSPEPTYEKIYSDGDGKGGAWLNDDAYYVIHRLASCAKVHGIFSDVLSWAFERTKTIRVDTHRDNHIMQHNFLARGFTYCGIIYLSSGDERLAYQKTIG